VRFESLWWLLVLIPATAAAVWAYVLAGRRSAALVYPAAGTLKKAAPKLRASFVRATPPALKLIVLLLVAFALARPQEISRQAAGLTEGIDILLVMDTSGSMRAIDFDPLNRMDAAKKAADQFIRGRLTDRIGLVVFGGDPILSCPLTLDYNALREYLQLVAPDMTRSEGTAIGDAIASAVNHIRESTARSKVLILLTDGSNNTGIVTPELAAKTAAAHDIKIYTIGTAKRGEALVPMYDPRRGRVLGRIPDSLDEDALTKIAQLTGGKYFRAENMLELAQVYAAIDKLEKYEFERPEIVSYTDLQHLLLIPAVILLGLELLLSRTLLLRVP
jgi:Ca-activated chloride channel family protein